MYFLQTQKKSDWLLMAQGLWNTHDICVRWHCLFLCLGVFHSFVGSLLVQGIGSREKTFFPNLGWLSESPGNLVKYKDQTHLFNQSIPLCSLLSFQIMPLHTDVWEQLARRPLLITVLKNAISPFWFGLKKEYHHF